MEQLAEFIQSLRTLLRIAFNPMATTEPFLRRTKFTSYLYILLSGLSILAQCKGNKYIQVSINALCMNEDISQNS